MVNTNRQFSKTNFRQYNAQYEKLVMDIESEVSSVVRNLISNAHDENSDGLKFDLGDNLDMRIHQYMLQQVQSLLDSVDDQESFS